jgi:hypothetical protein
VSVGSVGSGSGIINVAVDGVSAVIPITVS